MPASRRRSSGSALHFGPLRLVTACAAALLLTPATHLSADEAEVPAEQRVATLEAENAALRARVLELTERLERLEAEQRAIVPVEVERADATPTPPPTPATPAQPATPDPTVTPMEAVAVAEALPAAQPAATEEGAAPAPAAPAERVTVGPIQIEPEDVRGDVFLSAVARPDQPEISVFVHGRNTEANLGGRRFREQGQDRKMNWRINGETVILPVANYEWTAATSRIAGKKTQGRGDELIEFRVPRELLERASMAQVWEILVSRSTLTMGSEPRALAREALRER